MNLKSPVDFWIKKSGPGFFKYLDEQKSVGLFGCGCIFSGENFFAPHKKSGICRLADRATLPAEPRRDGDSTKKSDEQVWTFRVADLGGGFVSF